ncbi:MAG: hypothetical protein AB7K78_27255, partial [Xanthobacteraceae bacterium]
VAAVGSMSRGQAEAVAGSRPVTAVAARRVVEVVEAAVVRDPVHDAADEVGWITKLLVDNYPNEKGHRERSITVAAKRAGLRRGRLQNHLGGPNKLKE